MSAELTVELIKARGRTFDLETVFVLSLANCGPIRNTAQPSHHTATALALTRLSSPSVLCLSTCTELTALSSHLALCINLRILDLSHNQLTSLALLTPATFPHLHMLHAHHNCLTSLDSLPPHPTLTTVTFHHNKLTSAVEWRDGWQSVDGQVKRAEDEDEDEDVEWKQYLATVEREEAANIAARARTAKPATLPLRAGQASEDAMSLPTALVAKSNMDKEKLRGMLDEWDELSTACDNAVSTVCNRYSLAV